MTKVFALGCACLVLAACGGGASNSPPPTTLTLSTSSLSFDAANTNQTPASQIIRATVSGVDSGTLYIRVVVTGPAVQNVSNIVVTGPTTGQASVIPASASVLGVGTHVSTITVTACTTDLNCSSGLVGSPQTIGVTYTVRGASLSAVTPFTIGDSPLAADLARQTTLKLFTAESWTASTSASWLTVAPASGSASGATALTLSVAQSQIDPLNNGTYTANVTATPMLSAPVTVPVTLTITRTQTNFVAPYVALANTSAEVIIRGDNYGAAVSGVKFGNLDAVNYRVVNATEIRATHPVLAVGRYPIQVVGNIPINRSFAELVVVAPPNFAAAVVAHPGNVPRDVYDVVYDAEREALLIAMRYPNDGPAASEILRYRLSGAWSIDTRRSVRNVSSLALSPDGRALLAGANTDFGSGGSIVHLDPATLAIAATTPVNFYSNARIAVANAGYALFAAPTGVSRYSIGTRSISPLLATSASGSVGASIDGSLLLFGGNSGSIAEYDSTTGVVRQVAISLSPHTISIDRTGSRYAGIDPAVARTYTRSHTQQCGLPVSTTATVVAPNGRRVYLIDTNGLLRTFDLTAAASVGNCPEIGAGTALAGDPGQFARTMMAISPDGGTLFIVGAVRIVVQPAP